MNDHRVHAVLQGELSSASSSQSDELLRLMTDNVADYAIFAMDIDGNIASWNRGVEKLFGYTETDFLGMDTCHIFTAEDNAQNASVRERQVAAEHGRAEDQRWHVRKDGSRFWANGLLMTLKDETGSIRGFAKIMRDDTRRKQIEDDLRLRDRAILSTANGIAISDMMLPDYPLVYVNPAFERITGYSSEECLGRNCRFLQGVETDQRAVSELRRAIEEQRTYEVTLRNYRKDGALFWNQLSVSPVRDDEGRLTHYIGVQQDVTDRVTAEADRAHLQQQIARAQAARVAGLSAPLLPIGRDVLIMPLIGTMDAERAIQALDAVSEGVRRYDARIVLIDITGVREIDEQVAALLIQSSQIVYLLGAQVVLTGIRARVAQALGKLGVDMSGLVTRKTLSEGLQYAEELTRTVNTDAVA